MATKFISFANNQRFLRVTNSRTNTISYVSKLNLVIEKDNHESFYLKNDDFIKYYKYKDVLYPSSRDMANLVTKLVDICQGDAATENMLLDEIKRSPVVTELKILEKDDFERTFCTKVQALVGDNSTPTVYANELMNMNIDGMTALDDADIRFDIYGRTRDYGNGPVPDYTTGSLVGYNMGHDSEREQIYELKLCANDGIRFATGTNPILKRSIIQQSKEYVDIPMGKTRIALMSAALIRGPADQVAAMDMYNYIGNKTVTFTSRVGMFNDVDDILTGGVEPAYRYSNGIYFEYKRVFKEDDGDWNANDSAHDDDVASPDIINELNLVLMINGGIITIPQSNFNIDRVNGNGPSGVIFDPSRITTFMFKFGNMNDTVITAGLFNEGSMILVHTFVHEDLKDFNYSAKLPMRWDFQVESTIQSGTGVNSLIVDNMVMLRGSGAVYSNESLDLFNENKTFLLPVKKNFIDDSAADLTHNPDPSGTMVYHSMNSAVRIFKTFTPLFNKDIMFGIRLGGDYRRNKVQLNSIMFQSDDATNKTLLWKIIRNGKYRRLMWRLNIPELRQNRSMKILYTNSVGESHYYTPNDITLHRAQTLPVLMYDSAYAQDHTLSESNHAWEDSHIRIMTACEFDGSYLKNVDAEGTTVKKYVDLNDVEDPANGRFTYQYFEGTDKDTAFGHIKHSMCELWSMESQMTDLDSPSLTTSFTMIPNEGKYFVDDPDNPGTSLVRYNGIASGIVRDYETAFVNGYTTNDIFDVEETYTSKPNIQASGIAQFTNYTTIDISNMTPIFSDIEGKSDEYVLQVEFGPNSVSDVNLQTAVNWMEYQ